MRVVQPVFIYLVVIQCTSFVGFAFIFPTRFHTKHSRWIAPKNVKPKDLPLYARPIEVDSSNNEMAGMKQPDMERLGSTAIPNSHDQDVTATVMSWFNKQFRGTQRDIVTVQKSAESFTSDEFDQSFINEGSFIRDSKSALDWLRRVNFSRIETDEGVAALFHVIKIATKSDQEKVSQLLSSIFLSDSDALTSHSISLLNWRKRSWLSYFPFVFQQGVTDRHRVGSGGGMLGRSKTGQPNKGVLTGLTLLHCLVLSDNAQVIEKLREDATLLQAVKMLEHEAFKHYKSSIPLSRKESKSDVIKKDVKENKNEELESESESDSTDLYETPESSWQYQARVVAAALGLKPWRSKYRGHHGVRILCLDGGGTRGVATIKVLQQLKRETGLEMHEMFDLVVGTSTGAIIASLIGVLNMPLNEIEQIYDRLIPEIFQKSAVLSNAVNLGTRGAYYDHRNWEKVLHRLLGDRRMLDCHGQSPSNPVVMCLASHITQSPASLFMCRSAHPIGSRHAGSCAITVRHAIRMSSAAPSFFTPLELNGATYCDGALVANNPSAVACYEASRLWPDIPLEALVSVGTGLRQPKKNQGYGWGSIIKQIIASATDTERVHETMDDFLHKDKYFRFNPLADHFPIDETNPALLSELKQSAVKYCQEEEEDQSFEAGKGKESVKSRLKFLAERLRKR